MANKPFTSQCTNVYNETTYNTIPNAFGLRNVTAMQTHDRTVCDTVKTCLASNFQPQMQMSSGNYCGNFNKSQVIYAQPQLTPRGGVTFTFNPAPVPQCQNLQNINFGGPPVNTFQQMQQTRQQLHQQPLTLQQQIALKQLEQQGLELMLIQEQLKKNPYKIKFHYNGQTSTTDLLRGQSQVPPSGGMPELKNALAALAALKKDIASLGVDKLPANSSPNSLYSEVYKAKRLILTKSPDIINKDKPKTSPSCVTNEHTEYQQKSKRTSDKEIATTSRKKSSDGNCRKKSSDEKSKKVCKKPKKSKKKPSNSKRKNSRSNPESSISLLDSASEDSETDDYDDDDDSEESD